MSVPSYLATLALLEMVTMLLCRGELTLTTDDQAVVKEMCQAQYIAWCSDQGENCTSTSHVPANSSDVNWLWKCAHNCTNQTEAESEGTCSNLANGEGYLPEQPDVSVNRMPLTQAIELSWRADPQGRSKVVYVIATSQPNASDTSAMEQLSETANLTYQVIVPDICWTPEIRVAAVSPYGSRWFSDVVDIQDLIPGSPQDINLTALNYDPDIDAEFISYTLEWRPPDGWSSLDLKLEHKFDHVTECIHMTFLSPMYLFVDKFHRFHDLVPSTSVAQGAFGLTGRIPVDAVGCNITFSIRAVSRCSRGAVGAAAHYSFNLSCDKVPRYTGENCGTSPVVFPGQVKDARFVIVQDTERLLGLVSWRPPDSLGSFSSLDSYHVFWGIMDLMNSDPITQFSSLLGNVTVDGTKLETDLDLNVTWLHPEETVGVMITAAGQGQVIDMPFSDIYIPANGITSARTPGSIITDDGTIVVLERDTGQSCGVDIFWRRTQVEDADNLAVSYDIQWGQLSGGENNTDQMSAFTPMNTTRVEEAFITLPSLLGNTTYGIKIVPVFNVSSDVCDEHSHVWNHMQLHTFTTSLSRASQQSTLTPALAYSSPTTPGHPVPGLNTLHVIAVAISGILASVTALFIYVRMRRRHQRLGMLGVVNVTDTEFRDYAVFAPGASPDGSRPVHCPVVADEWELPLSCVKFGHVLGSGAFGKVVKGQVTRAILTHRGVAPLIVEGGACFDDVSKLHVTVAIKMLQEDCDSMYKQDFLKEIQLMKTLGHHRNVVSMLGCCTLRDPICLVVEHAEFGDLLNYLKDVRQKIINMASVDNHYVNRDTNILTSKDLVKFAYQVALGMDFLASKGFVHRDLAARNVLMCANTTCKIGDFGLARYIYDNVVYVNRRGGRLPIKWMSVEAIFDMSFSTASDVWSFGILLYEIVTLGGTPYPTIPTRELLLELQRGYRMEQPGNCSSQMYDMMMQCWQANPSDRPTFTLLFQWLQAMIEDVNETDHSATKLGFDRHLYKTDEDAVFCVGDDLTRTADQESVTTSDTSVYGRVVSSQHQEAALACYKAVSEDSGYCSPQKESISSGESTMTSPSGTVPCDTKCWTELMPGAEMSTHFLEGFSEIVVDDVFHEVSVVVEDERNTVLQTKVEKDENTSSKLTTGDCSQQQLGKLGQAWTCHSEALRQKREDKRKQFWYQSLSKLSDKALATQSVNYINHTRRKSDSDILINFKLQSQLRTGSNHKKTTEKFHKKTSLQTTEMSRRTRRPAGNKQRRKAVVIPPTLALDNQLYHGGEILRQNPPVVCITRRKPRSKASGFVSVDTWTCDGEFNFTRVGMRELQDERKVCPTNTSELDTGTGDMDKPLDHPMRGSDYVVDVEVRRDLSLCQEETVRADSKSEPMSARNLLAMLSSETSREGVTCLPDQTSLSPRTHRTFVRSHCQSIFKDTPVWKFAGKRSKNEKNSPQPSHQYADFKQVIKQSSSPSQVSGIGNEDLCQQTNTSFDTDSLFFDFKTIPECPPSSSHREMEHKHPDTDILPVTTTGSQICRSVPLCCEVLDSLSQAVRRTYSSPKEHTLAGQGLSGEELQLKAHLSHMLRRRLSDPFMVPETKFSRHSTKCQLSTLSIDETFPEADSPGLETTCFQWPHARARKETVTDRPRWELDSATRKSFPHEKHPAVLHHVSSPDNIPWG